MATTLTKNLKLKVNSNLTAEAKYNLERLDLIGANFLSDTTDSLLIRSRSDVTIEPQSADLDGTGIGGTVNIGTPDHILDAVNIYATSVNLPVFSLLDVALGGSKHLSLTYKSDINGPVDTLADRSLFIDMDGADRNLVLGANFSLTGADLELQLVTPLVLTLPSGYGSAGQILSTDGTGVLSWSSAGSGTGDVKGFAGNWMTSDGTTISVTHSLNSTNIDVTVLDVIAAEVIWIDSIQIVDSNSISLTSSEAPGNTWRVVVQAK